MRTAPGPLRVVGAGHSFTPLVKSEGTIVSLEKIEGLVSHDAAKHQARVRAGTRLGPLMHMLQGIGQGLPNMGDIDRQAIGGALGTATHGSGPTLGAYHTQLETVQIVDGLGKLREYSRGGDQETIHAIGVALGAFGILTEVTLNNIGSYRLRRRKWVLPIADMLRDFETMMRAHRSAEFYYIPFSGYAQFIASDLSDTATTPRPTEDDEAGLRTLRRLRTALRWLPSLRRRLILGAIAKLPAEDYVQDWLNVYASDRQTRFNEMEYHLPFEEGPKALAEIIALTETRFPEVYFPMEVRSVAADEFWLSPFYKRPTCSIAIHHDAANDPSAVHAGGRADLLEIWRQAALGQDAQPEGGGFQKTISALGRGDGGAPRHRSAKPLRLALHGGPVWYRDMSAVFRRAVGRAEGGRHFPAVPAARPRQAGPQHRSGEGATGPRPCRAAGRQIARLPAVAVAHRQGARHDPLHDLSSAGHAGRARRLSGCRHALWQADAGRRGEGHADREATPDWSRVCWLIDTKERLAEYGALAAELGIELRFAFEVDVGLHRGGFASPEALKALSIPERLHCEGVMAYEAHAPEIPGLFGGQAGALKKASALAEEFADCLGEDQRRILNIGGSKTALLHNGGVANEVSIGSAFVLPSDFDKPGLAGFQPAAFIATPILKAVEPALPGPAALSRMLQTLGLFPRQGCYLYGGKWMAKPVFPEGMKTNSLIGLSSNQQFMGLPGDAVVRPGDYAFLRPTQSEAVLQHFGSIAVLSGGRIVDRWPALPMR